MSETTDDPAEAPAPADPIMGGRAMHPPQTWAAAREDYLRGFTQSEVCARHGLKLGTLKHRMAVEEWRRADQPAPGAVRDDHAAWLVAHYDGEITAISHHELADLADSRMRRALLDGRATEVLRWRRIETEMRQEARRMQIWREEEEEAERQARFVAENEAANAAVADRLADLLTPDPEAAASDLSDQFSAASNSSETAPTVSSPFRGNGETPPPADDPLSDLSDQFSPTVPPGRFALADPIADPRIRHPRLVAALRPRMTGSRDFDENQQAGVGRTERRMSTDPSATTCAQAASLREASASATTCAQAASDRVASASATTCAQAASDRVASASATNPAQAASLREASASATFPV